MKKQSLLFNKDLFENYDSLQKVFEKITELPDRGLGYIITQESFSNIQSQVALFYNLNSGMLKKFDEFCYGFQAKMVNGIVFYSFAGCGCNNPNTIYYSKPQMEENEAFFKWFKDKPFNKNHNKHVLDLPFDYARVRDSQTSVSGISEELSYIYYQIDMGVVKKDSEGFVYTPYRICDTRMESGHGCAVPDDWGYIKRGLK